MANDFLKRASELLLGKRIAKVEYMHSKEAQDNMWYKLPIMLMLEDGTWLVPQMDDEGNDGGALACHFLNKKNERQVELFPVFGLEEH